FIDLLGYRKYGHNEGDEPRFTQPQLYKAISKHNNVREIYKQKLENEGIVGDQFIDEMEQDFKNILENHFEASKKIEKNALEPFMPDIWKDFTMRREEEMMQPIDTTLPTEKLKEITKAITELPETEKFIRKEVRLHEQR